MIKIAIAEAAPLIFLAARDTLDILTRPAIPVLIPDIVYFEAVRLAPVRSIVPWALANGELVMIKLTDAVTLRDADTAVGQIIADEPDDRIVLLCRDMVPPRSENIMPITVRDYANVIREMQLVDDLWDLVQRYAPPS